MRIWKQASLLVAALHLGATLAMANTYDTAQSVAGSSRYAATRANVRDASASARDGFDAGSHNAFLSPPLVAVPPSGKHKKPTANLVVGEQGSGIKWGEPKTPLTKDGKAKKQKSGKGLWWTLGGAAAGAGLGFLIAGPIGALIGGLLGALAGYFFGP